MLKSIIIDAQEPPWIQSLTFGGVSVKVAPLTGGDVWAATDDGALLVIERKEGTDLLGSIEDGRLFSQAAKMREISDWCYVTIIGQLTNSRGKAKIGDHVSGWHWNAVQGALLTVQELGVNVIYSDDFEHTVIQLANRNRDAVKIKPVREPSLLSDGEVMLTALPGIGPTRVDSLLTYCGGSPAEALAFLSRREKDLPNPPGIGLTTRLKCRQAMKLSADQYLEILLYPPKDNGNGKQN